MSAPTYTEEPHRMATFIRRFAPLIALFWLGLAVGTNVFVPQLETVAEAHNVSLSPQDAPSVIAMKRIGHVFDEFHSDSSVMIVLEGDQPLGAEAHHYYDGLVAKLTANTAHVEHVADFWSDPLTAVGSQSAGSSLSAPTRFQVSSTRKDESAPRDERIDAAWFVVQEVVPAQYRAELEAAGRGTSKGRAMIRKLHSAATKELNIRDGTPGRTRLWQNYRETHLTHQHSYLARLHYVHQNAVHHGLVRVGSDWPWCSAGSFKRAVSPAWLKTITRFPFDEIAEKDGDLE